MGFPGRSDVKESACSAGDPGLIPGSGRFPGGRNSYPHQYSSLEDSLERGAWWATVRGMAKGQTLWLTNTFTFFSISLYLLSIFGWWLVSWACLEGLEQHRFIPSGFWRTEGQNQGISRGHTFSQGSRESLPCLCQHLWWLSLWWPTSHITCVTSLWHTQLAHTALQFLAPSSPCLFPFNVWVQTLNVSFLFL